jgi:uncharacterized protein YgbK (DUF1537 family)
MSKHPTTPMDEADLRAHLAKQTRKSIALFDVLHVAKPQAAAMRAFDEVAREAQVVLIDLLYEEQLATVGALISARANGADAPLFVVGSSGVEAALEAHWRRSTPQSAACGFAPVRHIGPILAICGSCSPVTAAQMQWAASHGFVEVSFDTETATRNAVTAIREGHSVVLHARRARAGDDIGPKLGRVARNVIEATRLRRVLVAGGDTSGQVARALGIESLEMIGELTRGAPLCRATAPHSPADSIEVTFKGGQIGPVDFFGLIRDGTAR